MVCEHRGILGQMFLKQERISNKELELRRVKLRLNLSLKGLFM